MQTTFPLVTITSSTYNRELYIAQAIEGMLMQITNFPLEIIISDNCSTDRTIDIIKEYQAHYPGKITLLTSNKNYGMMVNFQKVIEAANGKYIANCDGDDYWTDPCKLQKQVDFLESNPDYSMCFTNTLEFNQLTQETWIAKKFIWDTCDTSGLLFQNSLEMPKFGEDLCTPGHISSIVFRNKLFRFPEWYKNCYVNDETLYLMLSKFGKAKFFNDVATVYRITQTGYSTLDFKIERDLKGRIHYYKKMNSFLEEKYNNQFSKYLARYSFKLFKYYLKAKMYIKALQAFSDAICYNPKMTFALVNKKIID